MHIAYFAVESIMLHFYFLAGNVAAQRLGVSSYLVSRITGTIYIIQGDKDVESSKKVNVGLNLKFNKRNEEVRCCHC
jgi:5'-3' exoribonuclease 1